MAKSTYSVSVLCYLYTRLSYQPSLNKFVFRCRSTLYSGPSASLALNVPGFRGFKAVINQARLPKKIGKYRKGRLDYKTLLYLGMLIDVLQYFTVHPNLLFPHGSHWLHYLEFISLGF